MKYSVIDMGSNTVRLSAFEAKEDGIKGIFSQKKNVGLAGYTQDGFITGEGIKAAGEAIAFFLNRADMLGLPSAHIFATASLRGLENCHEAKTFLEKTLGVEIELISGEDEARYSFIGAKKDYPLNKGIIFDVGGGSTELAGFEGEGCFDEISLKMGCLSLYWQFVKDIFPGENELCELKGYIEKLFHCAVPAINGDFLGVGGSARALMKIAKSLGADKNYITRDMLFKIEEELIKGGEKIRKLLLRKCPDRLHTIIPGCEIICSLMRKTSAKGIYISRGGVREGYVYSLIAKDELYAE